MKLCGIVAEYNPFHAGHRYHLNESRARSCCDKIIVIMSGSLVQRGELAISDKFERAETALKQGADVVLELPALFACAPAQIFAENAVKILTAANVDFLSFGSECGDAFALREAARKKEDPDALARALKQGNSYPKAIALALSSETFSHPNDILAVEYLRALDAFASHAIPIAIKRDSRHDGDDSLCAAALRKNYVLGLDAPSISPLTAPRDVYERMGRHFLFALKRAALSSIKETFEVGEGLENRIKKAASKAKMYDEYLKNVKTKRYTLSRLRRISAHILLSVTKEKVFACAESAPYFKVLAAKESAKDVLSFLSSRGVLLMGSADRAKLSADQRELIAFDDAADLFFESVFETKLSRSPLFLR